MSGFEFLFTFYSLLLGLSIANIATDFADMWRERHARMSSVSTIFLGIFVLICVAQQWISFWALREIIVMNPTNLLICIAMSFPYIFVSQAMFPSVNDSWESLEDYYMAHCRVLQSVLLIPIAVSVGFNLYLGSLAAWPDTTFFIFRIGIPILLMVFRVKWLHRIGLILLIATMFERIYS
jgi:hypothetical protein